MAVRQIFRRQNPWSRCPNRVSARRRPQAVTSHAYLFTPPQLWVGHHRQERHLSTANGTASATSRLPKDVKVGDKRFSDFDLAGRTFVVTGGAQGLGLAAAEALVEAGGRVYCLDRKKEPDEEWQRAQGRVVPEWGGSLEYVQLDVTQTERLNKVMDDIASENNGIHGAIAAAGIQQITPALEYSAREVNRVMETNFTAAFMTAQAVARTMFEYKCHGSICLVASMSGSVANKGLLSPAYNSSKAAVIQLARNLAMEWSAVNNKSNQDGIRVNCLSPGHVLTPMVLKNFEEVPALRERWSQANMLGRLANTSEFKGAALFLMSNASTFMTGSNLIIDGGHTAW